MKNLKSMTLAMCLCSVVACNTKQGTGTLLGAGGGAGLGAIIGAIAGGGKGAAIGAAIGGAVGAGAGTLIGHHMDKVARETAAKVQNAKVEQVTDANGLSCVKVTFDSGLLFPLNKYSLNAASKKELADFAGVMKSNSDCAVAIKGYTDASGNDDINLPLSQNRANAVSSCLRSNGVPASQIRTCEGLGSADPIENARVSTKNRRVEVYLYASEAMIQAANNGTLK
jgi:outer membrane protein OmpA-like peptidoglycan-associated protein